MYSSGYLRLWAATFALLAAADRSFGDGPATPIERLIIIYQENRSFDHYYGTFPGVNGILAPGGGIKPELVGLQKNASGVAYGPGNPMPGFSAIPAGLPNRPFLLRTYYPSSSSTADPTHTFSDMRRQAGWTQSGPQLGPFAMDRFVAFGNTGPLVLGYYEQADIPRYWALAAEWTLADNFFQAAWGPSNLNYMMLIAGRPIRTSNGLLDQVTGSGRPPQTHRNIGDLLNDAGVSWAWYVGPGDEDTPVFDGGPFRYYANVNPAYAAAHFRKYSRFLQDMAGGNLPAVSFVQTFCFSEHAGFGDCYEDVFDSQEFVGNLVQSLQASSAWPTAAILVTYDECGGFWDHVSPPQHVDVVDGNAYDGTTHLDGRFYPVLGDGPRVPLLVVSPFARRHHVASGPYDSCSITRFIEDNWNLPRLNTGTTDVTRDATTNPLNQFGDVFLFPTLRGDANCDGAVSVSDIGAFVLALTDTVSYVAQFPDCSLLNSDVNEDAAVTVSDIGPFVQRITSQRP